MLPPFESAVHSVFVFCCPVEYWVSGGRSTCFWSSWSLWVHLSRTCGRHSAFSTGPCHGCTAAFLPPFLLVWLHSLVLLYKPTFLFLLRIFDLLLSCLCFSCLLLTTCNVIYLAQNNMYGILTAYLLHMIQTWCIERILWIFSLFINIYLYNTGMGIAFKLA